MIANDRHCHWNFLWVRYGRWVFIFYFLFFLSNRFRIFRWSFCFNTHLAGIMQGQHMQGYFSFAGWGLSTVWFNRTTRIVKPNIRQRYKSRPPDVLEIYQKVVLKWNLENYESPNSLVQQGIFFFLPIGFSLEPVFPLTGYWFVVWQCVGSEKGQIACLYA